MFLNLHPCTWPHFEYQLSSIDIVKLISWILLSCVLCWVMNADLKELPQIQSYDSLQSLTKNISKNKSGRKHDLVIAVSIFFTFLLFYKHSLFFPFKCFSISSSCYTMLVACSFFVIINLCLLCESHGLI